MSRRDLVFVVSRAFALYLISWALADITYLPERLLSLSHEMSRGSVLTKYDYWASHYLVVTSFLVIRILALVLAARSFWRCGSRVQSFFAPEQEN